MVTIRNVLRTSAFFAAASGITSPSVAEEGGLETYLLGSRDSMSGIIPSPGLYWNNDFVSFSGSAPAIAQGGVVLDSPDIDSFVYKLNATYVFPDGLFKSARLAFNVNVPIADADLDLDAVLASGLSGGLTDGASGLSDITLIPMIGWSKGNWHSALAFQFFISTGAYEVASIDVQNRDVNALSVGKNRFGFDPVYSLTYFNPANGFEVSGSFGITFTAENKDTDYQTAPQAHFEWATLQHFKNNMGFGLTGYFYQQTSDDTGAGADNTRVLTNANSLRAETYALGPIWTYSAKVADVPLNLKAKFLVETGARRRFEKDTLWITVGTSF